MDKDKIVTTALALLNERGLDALTTRVLADRLGVKQPALYWHFKDRRALLDAMNDAIEANFTASPPPPDMPWQDHVFHMGQDFRRGLMADRDGARVHAGTRANRSLLEKHRTVLVGAGPPIPLAVQLMVSVGRFVIGWVLEEQIAASASHDPNTPQATGLSGEAIRAFFEAGDDATFNTGLQMLITGAAAMQKKAGVHLGPLDSPNIVNAAKHTRAYAQKSTAFTQLDYSNDHPLPQHSQCLTSCISH